MSGFLGFSEDANMFLLELGFNNYKTWFEENKERYKSSLQDPLIALTKALTPTILAIDPELVVDPKRVISRIYRDVRFSKDKSPYRDHLWLGFKRNWEDWKVEPAFFFEIAPDHYRYGMGFYNVPKSTMDLVRVMIDTKDARFAKMLTWYEGQTDFALQGESYKRVLKPELPVNLQWWYQKKELYFTADFPTNALLRSPELAKKIAEGFERLAAFYHFFLDLRVLDKQA